MRVTFDLIRDGLSSINAAAEQLAEAQRQVSSGRRLLAPSDDPQATQRAIGEHAELGTIGAYTRSGDASSARLSAADSVMSDMIDKITSAIAQTTGARGSTATPESRNAIADALVGLRDAIASDVNTVYQGTHLFSGSAVDQTPYAVVAGAWTYQGDNATVQAQVDRGRQVGQAWDGQALVQGTDPQDLFTTFDNLVTAVRTGDATGMANGIDALERGFHRATQLQSRLGADENSVEAAQARLADLKLATDTRRAKDEDANIAEAITKMNQADMAYKSALGAVGTAERVSLLDYLR